MSSSGPERLSLGLICALPVLLAGCASASDGSTAPAPLRVTAPGRIDAASEARFLVAERDGVIAAVHVRAGQPVTRGTPLLSLACAAEQAQAAAARAQARAAAADQSLVEQGPRAEERAAAAARLAQAEALARDAAAALTRAEPLAPRGFVAAGRLDTLRAAVAERTAAVTAAQAQYQALVNGARADERAAATARADEAAARATAAAAEADRCTLRAPIAGTIARVMRRAGEFSGASAGTPLIVMADLSRLMVRAEIADRDAPRVHIGDRAMITIDGVKGRWPARVTELAAQMGRRSARSLDPTDRFDRDVREALLTFDGPAAPAVIGLRVNVAFAG